MSYNTTKADVDHAFAALKRAAERAGINRTTDWTDDAEILTAEHLILTAGSSTYGRPWGIMYRHPVTGGHYASPWGTVGTSKREAVRTLWAISTAIDETTDALGGYKDR